MQSAPEKPDLTWPARALIGGVFGVMFGITGLFDGWSAKELGSSAIAGAVFYALLGVFAGAVAHKHVYIVILCGLSGGVAGAAWAMVCSASMITAVIVGAAIGVLIAVFEFVIGASSQDDVV